MSNKHDVNVRKSTFVNFQIGLVASLLFTYVMFEVYTAALPDVAVESPDDDFPEEVNFSMDTFVIEKKPAPKELAVKVKPKVIPTEFIQKKDDEVLEKFEKEFVNEPSTETVSKVAPTVDSFDDVDKDEEIVIHSFIAVEEAPIFPGCETLGSKEEKAACFSKKIGRIVSKKFNTGLGERYGLKGEQRIYAQFDIDVDGVIKNVRVRAPHPKLQEETERVIDLFPKMTPGKQRGTPVKVRYSLPINFKIQN